MLEHIIVSLSAVAALIPGAVYSHKDETRKSGAFWAMLAVATIGALVLVRFQSSGQWQTGLTLTLWVTIFATLVLFAIVSAFMEQAWKLAALLYPYLLILGIFALALHSISGNAVSSKVPTGWIHAHIFVSVITYGLVTLAAVASLAAFVQERALKNKQATYWSRKMPPVMVSEGLLVKLLLGAETVLGLGLVTGLVAQYFLSGQPIILDHKTLLSLGAFVVIGGLLLAHYKTGVRGRQATRLMLLAYLLLTLGYPGVKFVTEILM